MLQMAAEGRVPAELPVKRRRDQQWYQAGQIPGLLTRPAPTIFAVAPAARQPAPPAAPPSATKKAQAPPPAPQIVKKDESRVKPLSSDGRIPPTPPPPPTAPRKTAPPPASKPVAAAAGFPVIVSNAATTARGTSSGDAAEVAPRFRKTPLLVGGVVVGAAAAGIVVGVTIWMVWMNGSVSSENVQMAAAVRQPALMRTSGSAPRQPAGDVTKEADAEASAGVPTKAELEAQAKMVASISNWQSIAGLKSFGVSNASLQVSRVWRMSAAEKADGNGAKGAGTAGNLLCVEIAIHNKSRAPLKYRGWNSYGANGAILADESGNVLPLVPLARTSQIKRMTDANVPGGATVAEVLVFEAPASEEEVLHLVLPYGVFYSNVRPPYRAIELTPDMVGAELASGVTAATAESATADAPAGAFAKVPAAAKVTAKTKDRQPPSIKDLVDNDPGFPMPPAESTAGQGDDKGKDAKTGEDPKTEPKSEPANPVNPLEP
jgi:hypothetical protein